MSLLVRQVEGPGSHDRWEWREPPGNIEPVAADQTCVVDDDIGGEEGKDVGQYFWEVEDPV